ncbi:glycosyltransferase involved in cell wall biosynthesis [Maribacter vaceletii]|uniref:Glycosyltransferase involved in cell wall biosynthesis n=1 Tax=Maribacter vaceletii TaxID=1206816 RepID=A0A495DU54_9FLAO|nr:glycosyltransferase family 4 protein [Maribacter vaceletii]RKR07173.1 glycosyltransferase involved in cell wall biosynthesis [Maribacter vaceletii]
MKILVISNNYPTDKMPYHGTFVYQLIQQFCKIGHEVTVIRPTYLVPKKITKKNFVYGKELAKVYRPKYLSTSAKSIFGFNTYRLGERFQANAIKRVVKKNKIEFDVVYAHFFTNAFIAVKALKIYNKPIFTAIGEYYHIDVRRSYYSPEFYSKTLSEISGFVAVSPQIQEKLISLGVPNNNIIVRPNGVDFSIFRKLDKNEMRKKYNLPLNKKLIVFVGRFVPDKGPLKLLQAIERIKDIGIIFIGSGSEELISNKIVFKDRVPANLVPELLSAADLFSLPTLHEGSCNAIVEAMACGLPIVSSDIPEIKVQCDPSFSRLVDPLDVDCIYEAINEIISSEEKINEMSLNALNYVKQFDITERAKSIVNFLEKKSLIN